VATNFVDGVDWFDSEKQTYLDTTRYDLGECIPVSIKILSDETMAVGHSRKHLIVAAFHGVQESRVSFNHSSNPSELLI